MYDLLHGNLVKENIQIQTTWLHTKSNFNLVITVISSTEIEIDHL